MKPYRYILITFLIGILAYVALNIAWYYSSETYKPNHVLVDTTVHFEDMAKLWTEYRKGHTEKK